MQAFPGVPGGPICLAAGSCLREGDPDRRSLKQRQHLGELGVYLLPAVTVVPHKHSGADSAQTTANNKLNGLTHKVAEAQYRGDNSVRRYSLTLVPNRLGQVLHHQADQSVAGGEDTVTGASVSFARSPRVSTLWSGPAVMGGPPRA